MGALHMKPLRDSRPAAEESDIRKGGVNTIKIAVFDESPLTRAGIVYILSADRRLEVVAVADTFRLDAWPQPDIVILDANIMMSEIGAGHFSFCCPNVLILAFSLDEDQFLAAFAAGACGYLLKGATESQLLEAVDAVHRGEGYVSPSVAAIMLTRRSLERRGKRATASLADQLSHREGEIFKLLATGLTNREIGQRLGVTEKTVKRYLTRIFEKLHVRNRVEAAILSRNELNPPVVQEANRGISIHRPSASQPPLVQAARKVPLLNLEPAPASSRLNMGIANAREWSASAAPATPRLHVAKNLRLTS
jgi:DNA-binding NarL/FixJ family response regulator